MIYIPNSDLDPGYNLAFEECVFELPTEEDILILWRSRPSVVCGRYQNIFQEVRVPEAMRRKVSIMRRMSGGGCVFHDPGNVNYTLILSGERGYDGVLGRALAALNRVGVPAARSGKTGLEMHGKKISGSAQRVCHGRLLHHGTLLFDADLDALRSLANGPVDGYRSRGIPSQPLPVTNIREELDRDMTVEEFMEALAQAFQPDRILGAGSELEGKARRLAKERYETWEWIFGNSPDYDFERQSEVEGAPLKVAYRARAGVITQLQMEWDGRDVTGIRAALEGERLDASELQERFCRILKDTRAAGQFLDGMM